MHLDIGQLITWAIEVIRFLQQLLGFGKGALESAKTAKELFDDTKSLIENPEKREIGIEQARIVSELLRSYALFGFLEYLYRTTMTAMILMIAYQIREALRRK